MEVEDSKIVFMVQDDGTLTNKADVQKTRFNIPESSSYAINGVNVLSATGLGSNVVKIFDKCWNIEWINSEWGCDSIGWYK